MHDVKKVVLAYSGGLDTSVILKWLQDTYRCEVVTFTADIGQGEELAPARAKATAAGVKQIYIDDLREEFVRDFVFPMFRANAIYEGEYLLGTSIARPLIAKRQIDIARETGADAVSHGATGKGNDQVRFELGYYALEPNIQRHRAVARMGSDVAREAARLRGRPRHSDRDEAQGRRQPVLDGRQPAAHQLRRAGARGSGARGRRRHVALDGVAGKGARRAAISRARIRARRHRRAQREEDDAGGSAHRAQSHRRQARRSAGSTWSRTATSA